MKRAHLPLTRSLCLLFCIGSAVVPSRPQNTSATDSTTLKSPGGGQVIYGRLASQISLADGLTVELRQIHAHFGERPQVENTIKSQDGNSLGAFFTVHAKNDEDTPMAGLAIVTATPNALPIYAVLFDNADRFPSTEAALLHLLAPSGQPLMAGTSSGPSTPDPTAPAAVPPMHPATGGDRSASICLPADWTIVQVAGGSLTAKGPHNEIVALDFSQSVIDPNSVGGFQLAHMPKFAAMPQARFPDEASLFTTFTSVLNQLRAARKLEPATFSLTSSRSFDMRGSKVRPLEAIYDLDLADGLGQRKASAQIMAFRTGSSPEWLMSVSSSSVPLAYAAAEESTMRAIIKSFQQNQAVTSILEESRVGHGGPGGDPIQIGPGHDGYMRGERARPTDCAAISTPANLPVIWPEKVAESFILDPAASEGSASPSTPSGKFTEWLLRSHPQTFEVMPIDQKATIPDY